MTQEPDRESEQSVILSYSRLASYRDCPYRCKHETVGGGPAALRGDCFHKAIEQYYRTRDFKEACAKARTIGFENNMPAGDIQDVIAMMTSTVNQKRYQWPVENVICIESDDGETVHRDETMFLVRLPLVVDGKRIYMRGKFDIVHNQCKDGIEIVDWKTGFKDASEFQAEWYALAAHIKYWKALPVSVRFVYTARGFSPKPTVYDANDIAGILDYVGILATFYVREQDWEPKLNANCKECSLKMGCHVHLESIARAPEVPEISESDINALMKWREHLACVKNAATKLYDEVTDKAKRYVASKGNRVASDTPGVDFVLDSQVQSYAYPFEETKAILEQFGLDWKRAAKFSSGEIDSAIADALAQNLITEDQAKGLEERLEGKKDKTGKWTVEPIRKIAATKETLKQKKQK